MSKSLRIIWAITVKDILDGLKNKSVLSTFGSALFLIIFYKVMPILFYGQDPPLLALYDAGNSSLVAQLEDNAEIDLREMSSQEDMERYLGSENLVALGLVLPADFDENAAAEAEIELEGYVDHWVSERAIGEIRDFFEAQLAEAIGKPVYITVESDTVFTRSQGGHAFIASLAITVVLTMFGVMVTPSLMLEERETKTLDALLVSPAGAWEVTAAKALAGLFYCLIGMVVVYGFNATLIVNWGAVIIATILGALFLVGIGLLLGSIFTVKQQLSLWGFILIQPLLLPVVLSELVDILPAGLLAVIRWVPTVALAEVLRLGFSGEAVMPQAVPDLALVAAGAALTMAIVAWVVRRSDR